jgi:hypothetical protein
VDKWTGNLEGVRWTWGTIQWRNRDSPVKSSHLTQVISIGKLLAFLSVSCSSKPDLPPHIHALLEVY